MKSLCSLRSLLAAKYIRYLLRASDYPRGAATFLLIIRPFSGWKITSVLSLLSDLFAYGK